MRQMIKTLASVAFIATAVYSQNMPYPQNKSYEGCIKPNIQQSTMNAQVANVYDAYIRDYLATYEGGYIIKSTSTSGGSGTATVSEAHGWGMVITALMAGHDDNAKTYFDGLLSVYKKYKNTGPGGNLMAWKLNWGGSADRNSNATDGDLDIAYALLIAYKQWGDESYYNTAQAIVNDIKQFNLHSSTKHVLLGNWASSGEEAYNYTRPSDWMGGHFRTFADAFNDGSWDNVANNVYTIYSNFQNRPYANSGLISDFVYYDGSEANSTISSELTSHGEKNQDKYATNAARVPWRMAADYAYEKSNGAKSALDNFNTFLNGKSLTNSGIKEGYDLDGDALNSNAGGAAYLAPFVAARIASTNQSSLTQGWNSLVSVPTSDAYQAAIRLQSMLLISGNWWHYNDPNTPDIEPIFITEGVVMDNFGDVDPQSDIEKGFGEHEFSSDYWKGGYGWMVEDWQPGNVKTSQGNVWQSEVWDGSTLTDPGNLNEVFVDGRMKLNFEDSSALYVNFPNIDKDDGKTDWFDLSDMTGLTIKAKGTGELTIIFNTFDEGTIGADSFWGGYSKTISLDGTEQEFKIIADLFSPRPFSEESKQTWTWKENGSKKVKGIALFAESAISAEIDFIKINGTNIKCETFGYPTPEDIGNVTGENVIAVADWKKYESTGSTGTITENKTGDVVNSVKLNFNHSDASDAWVSVVGGFFTEGTDFTALTAVEVIYSSNEIVKLKLPMEAATGIDGADGWIAEHEVLLPNTNGEVSTLPIALATFKQPYGTEVPMDASKIKSVSLGLKDGASTGEITIQSLKLAGANIVATPITSFDGSAIAPTGISQVTAAAGMVRANLSLPQAGVMDLMVVNTQGRVVARENLSVNSGVNTLSINMGGNATGVYYMVGNGAGIQLRQKFILQ